MTKTRLAYTLTLLIVLGIALALWASLEARLQRRATERSLRSQASVLAHSLAPALTAASSASRELDELVASRLLDNARLLAQLSVSGTLVPDQLEGLIESNDLDAVLIVGPGGGPIRSAGAEDSPDLLRPVVRDVAAGRSSEAVIDWDPEEARGHIGAAAAIPGGGAVVVTAHVTTAYALAGQLGVANLLRSTVGTGGVLYLAYREEPAGPAAEASWDDGPVPHPQAVGGDVRSVRGKETFEVEVPVAAPAGRSAALRVGFDAGPVLNARVSAMRRTALVGAVLAAFGLAGLGYTLVSRARAREREEGKRLLAAAEERRRRSERLASAGALAAGVAHEVRNPLNAISLAAQRIERKHSTESECSRFAGRIRSEVGRLEEIVKGFLDLARPATGPREEADLTEILHEVASLLEVEARDGGIALDLTRNPRPLRAVVDREAVRRAALNLIRNAIQVSTRGGRVEIRAEREGPLARVTVLDEGPGVSADSAEKLFDPFETERADGVGLGLALVRRVAEEHGGWARLGPRPGGGAEAVLELRAAPGEGEPN